MHNRSSLRLGLGLVPWLSVQVARPAGHSLGGAVAQLCTLDLLQAAGPGAPPNVSCVGFATPAVGNAALAAHIAACGWERRFVTYLLPGDSCVAVKKRASPVGK